MKRNEWLWSAFAILIAVALLWSQRVFLLGPFLHLRALVLGALPFIAFFPPAYQMLSRFEDARAWPGIDRFLFSWFGSAALACAAMVVLLTARAAFPPVVLGLSFLLILLYWSQWKELFSKMHFDEINAAIKSQPLFAQIMLGVSSLVLLGAGLLPPLGYDAHEYHLYAPGQYLRAGGWIAFPHNVYCAFPMNVEMLYMFPLAADSAAGCTVVNLLLALGAALGVARLAKHAGWKGASFLPALFFLTTGLVVRLVLQANIDLGVCFAAVILLYAYERFRDALGRGAFVAMACALGFALGAKYIAILSVLGPFLLMAVLDCIWEKRARRLAAIVWVALTGIALWSPWLIRNVVLYQNPLFPLLTATLGGQPEIFADLFRLAHATPMVKAAEGIGAPAPEGLFLQQLCVFFMLPFQRSFAESLPLGFSCAWLFGLPALIAIRKNSFMLRSFVFCSAAYLIWFFLTQRNDRFLASIYPVLAVWPCLGLAAIQSASARSFMQAVLAALIAFHIWSQASTALQPEAADFLFSPTFEEQYFAERLPHYRAMDYMNQLNDRALEAGRPEPVRGVLFVGEAQSYGARFNAIAPTVFNHHPLERGLNPSVSHIVANRFELERLNNGYGPLGWPLGARLAQWLEQNQSRLRVVFDAYPDKPGMVVVYEVVE